MDHFARIGTGRQARRARVIWRNQRLYVTTDDGTTVYDAPDEPVENGARNTYQAAGITWSKASCSCGYPRTLRAPMQDMVRQAEQRLAAGELTLAGTRDVVDA